MKCISILAPMQMAGFPRHGHKYLPMCPCQEFKDGLYTVFLHGDDDQALLRQLADKHDIVATNLVVK